MNPVIDDSGKLQSCIYETTTVDMLVSRDPIYGIVFRAEKYNDTDAGRDHRWVQRHLEDMKDILYAARVDFGVPQTAREKLHYLILEIGPGFHPDNEIEDYVTEEGEQTFLGEELELLSSHLADCWRELGTQIYNVGLELYQSMFPKEEYKKVE